MGMLTTHHTTVLRCLPVLCPNTKGGPPLEHQHLERESVVPVRLQGCLCKQGPVGSP